MQVERYPRWFTKLSVKKPPSISSEVNPYPKWLTWLGLAFSIMLCGSSFWDWFMIIVLSNERIIDDYRSVYHSPETYAASALRLSLICLPFIGLFTLAIIKGTQFYRLLAFACTISAIIAANLLT